MSFKTLEELFKQDATEKALQKQALQKKRERGERVFDEIKKRFTDLKVGLDEEGILPDETPYYDETFRICKKGLMRAYKLTINGSIPSSDFYDYKKIQ